MSVSSSWMGEWWEIYLSIWVWGFLERGFVYMGSLRADTNSWRSQHSMNVSSFAGQPTAHKWQAMLIGLCGPSTAGCLVLLSYIQSVQGRLRSLPSHCVIDSSVSCQSCVFAQSCGF
jgi:hypothetical protein